VLVAVDSWLTALGAFDGFNHGDHAGHLILAAAVAPVLFALACRFRSSSLESLAPLAVGSLAVAMTFALGLMWEALELFSDSPIGTDMSLGSTCERRAELTETGEVGAACVR
jgi:hypothetical protein